MPVIGFLSGRASGEAASAVGAFRLGLGDLGYSLTISELHYSFALFLFSFSGPMTQNERGATKWGKAKNGTASNRDKLLRTLCRIRSR